MRRAVLALSLTLAACASAAAGADISDEAIARFGAQPWDKRAMMFRTVVLGERTGVRLIAEHPCSDLCPTYTRRIVHFEVDPGPACEKLGGVRQTLEVPRGIAVTHNDFCVPKVLVDQGLSPNTKGK